MRYVVVVVQVVVYDGMVRVVSLQQVLECSRSLLCCGLDVMDLDRRKLYFEMAAAPQAQEGWYRNPWQTEHCVVGVS
jgi:hypothetical protein